MAQGVSRSSVVVGRDGRAKAYRPLPTPERAAAIEAGLAAYDRGDFFLAHEDLEPAWMGSADLAERAAVQGLIKVAAAYVHWARGNPAGIRRNLVGARDRLAEATAGATPSSTAGWPAILVGLDLGALLAEVDERLADVEIHPAGPTLDPPTIRRNRR